MRLNNKSKEYLIFLYCVTCSFILFSIPWVKLRGFEFRDKEVYLDYAYYGNNIINYKDFNGILSYISNEWLWHFVINSIKFDYIYFFNAITLTVLFLMNLFLVKRAGFIAPILLFNPLIIDMAFSQYRISLALIFILLAIFFRNKKYLFIIFLLFSILTHTSSILILGIFLICYILKNKNLKNFYNVIILCATGFLTSFFLSGYVLDFLNLIGDRRAEYDLNRVSSSISYLSFWILNLIFIIYHCLKFNFKVFEQYVSIVILSLVSMNALIGGYSLRFLSVFYIFIWISNLSINIYPRLIILNIYIIYLAIQWYYWLGIN